MGSLEFDPDSVIARGGHFIDGAWHTAPAALTVRRPSDGKNYGELPDAGEEYVDLAVRAAQRAQRDSDWNKRAPRERARVLARWADLMDEDLPTLGKLEAVGSTRPITNVVDWDVPFSADGFRFFAEFADKYGGDVVPTRSDQLGMVMAEPIGVIGAIAPWNFPLNMVAYKCAAALAAGNAVVLKPSELTPYSALRLAELAIAAGMPAGIFNVVNGLGHTTGDAMVRHPGIGKVTFTGSTRTGAAVMASCAANGLKPVTLELGGKSPQLVFNDAGDLDRVAECLANGVFANAGQVCTAGTRLIVQRKIADQLLERLARIAEKLKAGPTWHADTDLSPIISAKQAERISAIVDRALAAGATAVSGGKRIEACGDGAYFAPTILDNVDQSMEAVREEIFGPVLTVQRFDEEEEAIALANDTVYGLSAGVHTADLGRALRAVRQIQAGTVWVNRYGRTADYILPTGGYKQSGIGKDLGRQSYESYLRYKAALIAFG